MEHIKQRYASSPEEIVGADTQRLRDRFLVENLFSPGDINGVYTHYDRVVILGIEPAGEPLALRGFAEIRSEEFFDHREAGVINVGGPGTVVVDGQDYAMVKGACLYIGRGAKEVSFVSDNTEDDGKFYLFSAPAHTQYPTSLVQPGEGNRRELGDSDTSNRRTLNQYIHEGGVQSCQVVMGVTTLHTGSMWNTMPAHTHDRRMEAYLYFDVPEDARVIHLMGEPQQTRHLVVANEQAVISPNWSVHSGVGTAAYSFIWAMAGENKSFDDMDTFPVAEMR